MGKVVVSQFITVDGVVEDPGGSEGSRYGGWAFQFDRGAEGDRFKVDEVMTAGGLLLGRRTYEGFAQAWPTREGEFADTFNTMPKVRRLLDPRESGVEQHDGRRNRRRLRRRAHQERGRR